jgi:hypothetical protein
MDSPPLPPQKLPEKKKPSKQQPPSPSPLPTPQPTPTPSLDEQPTTLFWCLFRYHYGDAEYYLLGPHKGNVEMTERNKIMTFLQQNPDALRNVVPAQFKTKAARDNVMSALMIALPHDGLDIVIAQAVYYQIPVYILQGKTFIVYQNQATHVDDDDESTAVKATCIIRRITSTKYRLVCDLTVDDIKSKYISLISPHKPLHAVSHYKVDELDVMCNKIEVQEEGGTKQEKYTKIGQYISQLWK